jgi:hypothetical protein
VIDGDNAWFMDNGRHRYFRTMVGAGVSRTPNRLLRVALHDAQDHASWPVCGLAGGSITNPPLVDTRRNIVLGYDSANRVLQAWRSAPQTGTLSPLWSRRPFGCASHMLLYPDTAKSSSTTTGAWARRWWCSTSPPAPSAPACGWAA